MKNWVLAARPKTLSAALAPIALSWAIVSLSASEVKVWVFALALLSSIFIQIGTNLVNDASDFASGKDTTERLVPVRATANGLLSYKQVMLGAFACFALALSFGLPLVQLGGWPILVLGLLSIASGYAYTKGPFPLAYNGLGEIFVILFFGFASVLGLCWIQMKNVPSLGLVAGLQAGLLCSVLIAINNYRDFAEDTKTQKKTLAVRFGKTFAKNEISFLLLSPYAIGFFYLKLLNPGSLAFALPFLSLPLAWHLHRKIQNSQPSALLNGYLAQASLLYMFFASLLVIGLIV